MHINIRKNKTNFKRKIVVTTHAVRLKESEKHN